MQMRPDAERLKAQHRETRPNERLRAHYQLERRLADRLLKASRPDRGRVYGEVYDELFASLPDHPQHTAGRHAAHDRLERELQRIRPYLDPQAPFLEIGCGDGALAFHVAPHVTQSVGMDVTEALLPPARPTNFRFLATDGVTIGLEAGSVGFAYSNQLLEHLHPDDAVDQLREVARVLAPGGRYYCSTPSRVSGPHDISGYFDYQARGFHLKEYGYGELRNLFRAAGFRKVEVLLGGGARPYRAPYTLVRSFEAAVLAFPPALRSRLTSGRYVSHVLGIVVMGVK